MNKCIWACVWVNDFMRDFVNILLCGNVGMCALLRLHNVHRIQMYFSVVFAIFQFYFVCNECVDEFYRNVDYWD